MNREAIYFLVLQQKYSSILGQRLVTIVYKSCFSFWSAWSPPECEAERGLQTETGGTETEGGAGETEIQAERPNLLPQTQQLLRPDIPGVRIQVTLDIPSNNIKIVRNSMLPDTQGWAS